MEQQPQLEQYNQQIAELEAKLSDAYRTIEELREQNERLREQKTQLPRNSRKQTKTLTSNTIASPSSQARAKLRSKDRSYSHRTQVSQSRFKRLTQLQFIGIATGVGTAIAILGFALMRLFAQPSVSPVTQPQVPALPSTSSIPPVPLVPNQAASPDISFPVPQPQPISQQKPATKPKILELSYNVRQHAKLKYSQNLQAIVDEAVSLAEQQGLPLEPLSITLIDLKSQTFAKYQEQVPRFPASVAKIFWMVELYSQLENGVLRDQAAFHPDLYKMIQKSDNESASHIVDWLTGTTSGALLEDEEFSRWLQKRKQLNRFFEAAGYKGINISQKNFPIPYLRLDKPEGRDLQMRGNPSRPLRNKVTTEQAARLMYEIVARQAVSPQASEEMIQLMTRDFRPEVWKQEQYNSIQGFFGESLPIDNAYLASKVGWTFESRQEAAYIASRDGKAAYILVIFADAPAYGNDWKIFPKMSRLVFDSMVK